MYCNEKKNLYLIGLILFLSGACSVSGAGITYELSSRLGDRLITHIKAKWISYYYGMPLFCPFSKYFDQLILSDIEKEYNSDIEKNFNNIIYLTKNGDRFRDSTYGYVNISQSKFKNIDPQSNRLYVCNYYSEVSIDWNDKGFVKELKKTIFPKENVATPDIPKKCISVAVHVRKGGGWDQPLFSEISENSKLWAYAIQLYDCRDLVKLLVQYGVNPLSWGFMYVTSKLYSAMFGSYRDISSFLHEICDDFKHTFFALVDAQRVARGCGYADKIWPLKFPPDQYYIDQIKRLHSLLNKSPLHIHIFTDDRNPKRIINRYKRELNIQNITFSCRDTGNFHDSNVIQDLIAMTHYDCLIRSLSNFALISDIMGDFFIVMYPQRGYWRNNTLIMDKIKVKVNPENFFKISDIVDSPILALGLADQNNFAAIKHFLSWLHDSEKNGSEISLGTALRPQCVIVV